MYNKIGTSYLIDDDVHFIKKTDFNPEKWWLGWRH